MRSLTGANDRRTNPIKFAVECAVALIRKRFKEIADLLGDSQFGKAGFLQNQTRAQLGVLLCELTKHLTLLNDAANRSLIERYHDAVVRTAHGEQILLRIFKISFERSCADF